MGPAAGQPAPIELCRKLILIYFYCFVADSTQKKINTFMNYGKNEWEQLLIAIMRESNLMKVFN